MSDLDQHRHQVLVEVFGRRDGAFPFGGEAGSLDRVIASLRSIRETIPEPYREQASCEIASEYDSTSAEITISYSRPETDDEVSTRLGMYERIKASEEARHRAKFEASKQKFEPPTQEKTATPKDGG